MLKQVVIAFLKLPLVIGGGGGGDGTGGGSGGTGGGVILSTRAVNTERSAFKSVTFVDSCVFDVSKLETFVVS